MPIRLLSTKEDLDLYDRWVKTVGNGNLWQSLERKQYLEALGKEVRIYASMDGEQPADRSSKSVGGIRASALVMIDRTSGGYSTWDIPRGPIIQGSGFRAQVSGLLERIVSDAKKDRCLALYLSPIDPLLFPCSPVPLKPSSRHIHCEATRIIDLTASEEEILAQMKQKGRYNIKVAQKHEVTVKESDDIDAWFDLVKKTGKRDGFVSLSKEKYKAFLSDLPGSFMLLAYDKETEPIAGVLSVIHGERAIYYYGASNHAERAKMAPYLLQWESMVLAKQKGCTEYDLLGIAPPASAEATAGKENADEGHPWKGISSFKEKFGGEVVTYPKERVIVLKPLVYRLLNIKRRLFG